MKKKSFRLKQLDGAEGRVTAVIATLNVKDHDGDVTFPGAFGTQEVPVIPSHDWRHVPLGKASIREQGNDAIAEIKFNLDLEAGRDWFSALKFDIENGAPRQEYSYGFDIVDSDHGEFKGEHVQLLKKLKVVEVSPVMRGAGQDTRTLAVKCESCEEKEAASRDSGGPIEKHFTSVIETVEDFVGRVEALAALRKEEGRTPSRANRDRLSRLLGEIGDIEERVKSLLLDITGDDGAMDQTLYSLMEKRTAFQRSLLQRR